MNLPHTPTRQASPTEVLRYIVRLILAELPADQVCVGAYRRYTGQLDPLLEYPQPVSGALQADLHQRFVALLVEAPPEPLILSDLTDYAAALVCPLWVNDEITGVVVLLSQPPDVYVPEDAQRIVAPLSLARTVLENLHLYDALAQNVIISQLIRLTARTIVDDPSPQLIIDVLREWLFDSHITSCAMLLYGPVSEDRPSGPFDYLEMAGSWSRRLGGGVALGTKIYLKDYAAYIERLDNRETLVFTDTLDEFIAEMDPFARSIIRAEHIRSMTLLPLHAGQRKIGVLLVGADRLHHFAEAELETYQMVGEFLGIGAMAQILQQQHDLVQQGRAALLDAVGDGVVMVLPDAAGARVLTVNKLFTQYFGLTEPQAQGLLLAELLDQMQIPKNVRTELRQMWLPVSVRDPVKLSGEFHVVHAAGYPLDIEWYSAPVYRDRHVLGRIYIFHDVTAERTAVRLRSAFLSRVSHEVRTPLTSIHGFAQFILEVAGDDLPPLAREYTEIILNSARQLQIVFTDMIELTRANAGELKLNLAEAHLPDLIINTVAQLELQYKDRQQKVIMALDDDLPPVTVDRDRMIQVTTNLLTNAIKFSPEGSTIQISTYYVCQPDDLPDSAPENIQLPGILVSVIDEGPGISAEDLDQIFVPFFRTAWARKNQIEGTGLGLAVAASIIELHRGKIWVEAVQPGGHFFYCLPTTQSRHTT
jgi:signal transduction histidine kinase